MAINSTSRQTTAYTSGSNFAFAFKVFTTADVKVIKIQTSNNAQTILNITSDYTVQLNGDQNDNPGGSVTLASGTLGSGSLTGFTIVITSKVEAKQLTELTNQGGFFPEVINDALDKSVILHQQQQNVIDKTIRFQQTDSVTGLEITDSPTTRANKTISFDSSGDVSLIGPVLTTNDTATVSRNMIQDDAVNSDKIGEPDLKSLSSCQTGSAASIANLTNNEVSILDGATVSTTELNTLDGVNSTLTASELNTLDGITASTANLNQLTNKEVEISITANSDAKIPTSKAVNDRILTVTNALGGFVAIANETSFPATHPDPSGDAGTVVSISDAGGVVVNSSGVATITNGAGTGNTVTINSFPSDLHSKTLGSGIGLQVQTTTTLHTYTYHKSLIKESDLINLSNDIDSFRNRYRVVETTPSSDNDEGDLIFRKSDNKLLVYNGTAYQEASSVGNFHTNTLSSYNGTGGNTATFNGSAYRFNIDHPPELAEQLLVSINGVVQKPNSGTSQPSEGFAISGSSVIFSAAPASGSDFFIITIGKSVDIGVVSDGTIDNAKVASDASIEGTKINPNFGSQNVITSGNINATGQIIASDGFQVNDNLGNIYFYNTAATELLAYIRTVTGTDDYVEILANKNNSEIRLATKANSGNSNLNKIRITADDVRIGRVMVNDNTDVNAIFKHSGGVELYYGVTGQASSKKLETTSTGVSVTGGYLRIDQGSTVDGIVGLAYNTYFGLKHTDQTLNSEYMIISKDTHTYISASTGSNVYIRNGGNDQTNELIVGNGVDALTWRSNKVFHAGSNINLPDNTKLQLGASQDLELSHDGTSTGTIENNVGQLIIRVDEANSAVNKLWLQSNVITLSKVGGQEWYLRGTADGSVEAYYDNVKRFETTSTGASVTGNLGIGTTSPARDLSLHSGDASSIFAHFTNTDTGTTASDGCIIGLGASEDLVLNNQETGKNIIFESGGSERLRITSDGNLQIPANNKRLQIGANQELEIFRSDNHSSILDNLGSSILAIGSHRVNIVNGGNTEVMASFHDNGAAELYYDNVKTFETTNQGIKVEGTSSNTQVRLATNGGTIRGYLYANPNNEVYLLDAQSHSILKGKKDAQVELFYDNVKRLETTSTGASVTGILKIERGSSAHEAIDINTTATTAASRIRFLQSGTSKGEVAYSHNNNQLELLGRSGVALSFFTNFVERFQCTIDGHLRIINDNAKLQLGADQDLDIYHTGVHGVLDNITGALFLKTGHATSGITLQNRTGNETMAKFLPNAAVELCYDNVKKLETTSNGILVYNSGLVFQTTASGTNTFGDIQIPNDTGKIKLGASQDLELFHNGSHSKIISKTGNLTINSAATTGAIDIIGSTGQVKLFYGGSSKLETTSTGVDVTGKISENGVNITSKATAFSLVFS